MATDVANNLIIIIKLLLKSRLEPVIRVISDTYSARQHNNSN